MKTSVHSLIIFLMFLLASCQESVYVDDTQTTIENDIVIVPANKVNNDIVSRLQAFNDSLANNVTAGASVNGTSSVRDKYKKWIDVSIKDFFGRLEGATYGVTLGSFGGPEGSLIGAVILSPLVGAFRSYEAAFPSEVTSATTYQTCVSAFLKMKEETLDYSKHYPLQIKLNLSDNKRDLQADGAKHNIILGNLENKRSSMNNLGTALKNGVITQEEYDFFTSRETITLFYNLSKQPSSSIPSRVDFGIQSNAILNLYKEAIENTTSSYEDVENISNRYISEIYSSAELEEDQKDNITSSIGVMVSSVEYWKVFDAE